MQIPKKQIVRRILEGLFKEGYESGLDPDLEAAIIGDSTKLDGLVEAGEMKKEDEQQIDPALSLLAPLSHPFRAFS